MYVTTEVVTKYKGKKMEGRINKYVGADNVQDRGAAVDNGATALVQQAMVPLVWCCKQGPVDL